MIYDHECNGAEVRRNFGDVSLSCQMPRRSRSAGLRLNLRPRNLLKHDVAVYCTTSADEKDVSQNINLDCHRHARIQPCAIHLGCQLAVPFQGEQVASTGCIEIT